MLAVGAFDSICIRHYSAEDEVPQCHPRTLLETMPVARLTDTSTRGDAGAHSRTRWVSEKTPSEHDFQLFQSFTMMGLCLKTTSCLLNNSSRRESCPSASCRAYGSLNHIRYGRQLGEEAQQPHACCTLPAVGKTYCTAFRN